MLAEACPIPVLTGTAERKGTLLANSVYVSGISIAVGMLGMVNQMLLARTFGAGREMDVYFGAITVPTIVAGIAPPVIGIVALPLLIRSRMRHGASVVPTLFWATAVLAAAVTALGMASSAAGLRILMPGLAPEHRSQALEIARLFWISAGLSLASSFLIALRHSHSRFVCAATVSLLPPVFTISSVLLLGRHFGVTCVAWGMVGASLAQFCALLPGVWKEALSFSGVSLRQAEIWECGGRLVPAVISLLPFTASSTMMAFWAARTSTGAIATFGYCHSFSTLLSVAVGYGVAVVSFPEMSRRHAGGEPQRLLADAEVHLRQVTIVAAFCLVMIGTLRRPLLEVLLEHGKFGKGSVDAAAAVLPWFLFAGCCVACLNLLRNLYYATGRYRLAAGLGLAAIVQLWVSAGVLGHFYGIGGIAAAFAASSAAYFSLALFGVRAPGRPRGLWSRGLATHLAQLVLASTIAWAGGAAAVGELRSSFGAVATLALGGPVVAVICLAVATVLPATRALAPALWRRGTAPAGLERTAVTSISR